MRAGAAAPDSARLEEGPPPVARGRGRRRGPGRCVGTRKHPAVSAGRAGCRSDRWPTRPPGSARGRPAGRNVVPPRARRGPPATASGRRGRGLAVAAVRPGRLEVRLRRGGERLRIDTRRPRRALKALLQESGVPPWDRERLPLLYCGGELAWVAGIGVAAALRAGPGEAGFEPVCKRSDAKHQRETAANPRLRSKPVIK